MKGYRGPNSIKRRNDRMFEIFERAKAEGRGLSGDSGIKGHGVHSPAMEKAKSKAIHAKINNKK